MSRSGPPQREPETTGPELAVAVATCSRALRLRWLLNALEEQQDPGVAWEVVVAFNPRCRATARVLMQHPLRQRGRLRAVSFPPGRVYPGAARNLAWRATSAPLVLFTDDDCAPPADWLRQAVRASARNPSAILQGATRPDPADAATLFGATWVLTQEVRPPTPWGEACNLAYPRPLLERLGGFDEDLRVGEDCDLSSRGRQLGARLIPASEMLTFHAVQELWLPELLAGQSRLGDFALVIKRHPRLRRHLVAGVWWRAEHAALWAGAVGVVVASRGRSALGVPLVAPWLALSMRHQGRRPRGLARAFLELPGRALSDAVASVALARGSIRHRTLVL